MYSTQVAALKPLLYYPFAGNGEEYFNNYNPVSYQPGSNIISAKTSAKSPYLNFEGSDSFVVEFWVAPSTNRGFSYTGIFLDTFTETFSGYHYNDAFLDTFTDLFSSDVVDSDSRKTFVWTPFFSIDFVDGMLVVVGADNLTSAIENICHVVVIYTDGVLTLQINGEDFGSTTMANVGISSYAVEYNVSHLAIYDGGIDLNHILDHYNYFKLNNFRQFENIEFLFPVVEKLDYQLVNQDNYNYYYYSLSETETKKDYYIRWNKSDYSKVEASIVEGSWEIYDDVELFQAEDFIALRVPSDIKFYHSLYEIKDNVISLPNSEQISLNGPPKQFEIEDISNEIDYTVDLSNESFAAVSFWLDKSSTETIVNGTGKLFTLQDDDFTQIGFDNVFVNDSDVVASKNYVTLLGNFNLPLEFSGRIGGIYGYLEAPSRGEHNRIYLDAFKENKISMIEPSVSVDTPEIRIYNMAWQEV